MRIRPSGTGPGGTLPAGRRREDGEADQAGARRSAALGPPRRCAAASASALPPLRAARACGPRPGVPPHRAVLPRPADSCRDSPFPKVLLASPGMVSRCLRKLSAQRCRSGARRRCRRRGPLRSHTPLLPKCNFERVGSGGP